MRREIRQYFQAPKFQAPKFPGAKIPRRQSFQRQNFQAPNFSSAKNFQDKVRFIFSPITIHFQSHYNPFHSYCCPFSVLLLFIFNPITVHFQSHYNPIPVLLQEHVPKNGPTTSKTPFVFYRDRTITLKTDIRPFVIHTDRILFL